MSRRRWEAAKTHRLNSAHWTTALGQSLNADLLSYLETLRARCEHEGSANATVDGMIFTHQNDVVGIDGPTLQVQSDSPAYNDWLEAEWQDWFRSPMPNPRISGATWLRLCIRGLWQSGEYLAQKITKKNVTTPCAMRIKPIHPSRLMTPSDGVSNPRVIMGVELSEDDEPVRYYIQEPNTHGGFSHALSKATPLSPDDVIHEFLLREEDQVRGVPLMAPSLQSSADLRDFDDDVLDASRQAANVGVYWHTQAPEAGFLNVSEQLEMERGTQSTGPPGWKPEMLAPQQPNINYPDYRHERLADHGRPAGMPLMMIRLDSSGHNYSSARFDDQGYGRAIQAIQYWMSGTPKSTGMLSGLVDEVDREAGVFYRSKRRAVPLRPARVRYEWTWPVRPHVDPAKEGLGERIGIENGTLPFSDACAARGTDEDAVIAKQKRTNEKLAAEGMPPLPPIGAYPKKPMDFSSVFLDDEDQVDEGAGENQTSDEERMAHV
jgi:capsid protein